METEKIELPKQLVESIRVIVKETRLFENEEDFITQSIIKQISSLNKNGK